MLSTTLNESWYPTWNNCRGSKSRISHAAPAREFNRSCGRLNDHPASTRLDIRVARTAEACQPVAAA